MKVGLGFLADRNLYREYKRRLNARDVLDYYNAENCHETLGPDGTVEVVHSCLLDRVEPHHRNGDRNPSASINLSKKTFICYNYWGGDLFHLIMKMEKKNNLNEIIPLVGEFLDGSTSSDQDFLSEINAILAQQDSYSISLPEYSTKILDVWSFSHPYIRERGITLEASSKLQIGFDQTTNRIVFPHFWEGKFVGWQQRAIPEDPRWPGTVPPMPKYKNSTGFPKSETLYGVQWLNASGGSVIVVESPMSVAKAHSLGITNVIATFGAKVSQSQTDYLKQFSEVIVWFDSDPAGLAAQSKILKDLYRHTSVKAVLPEKDKDLADYGSFQEIQAMIDGAVPAILVLSSWNKRR